jgi:hypothetical protein
VLEHLRERLDRGDTVTERDEYAGQLSRPGAEIDDVARRVAGEPAYGLLGIRRPRALVRVGDVREGRCGAAALFIAVHDHV